MHDQLLIYGKIIIDSIQLRSGELLRSTLGGGGPQRVGQQWRQLVGRAADPLRR